MIGRRRSFWVIFGILYSLFIGLFLWPQWQEYREQQVLQKQYEKLSSQENLWKNYRSMKEEKELKAKYLNDLEKQLYSEKQLSQLVEVLQQVSTQAQVQILDYVLGATTVGVDYPLQNLKLTIHGDYPGILTFLSLLGDQIAEKKILFIMRTHNGDLNCSIDLDFYLSPKKKGGVS